MSGGGAGGSEKSGRGAPIRPWSLEEYAFTGEVRFTLAVEMLGVQSVRHARIRYWCTPAWEYCDARGVLRPGVGRLTFELEIKLCSQRVQRTRGGEVRLVTEEYDWEVSDLLEPGRLDAEALNSMEKLIEEQVQREDAVRREVHGLPQCAYPAYLRPVPVP